jgi:protein-disulfide isomerase
MSRIMRLNKRSGIIILVSTAIVAGLSFSWFLFRDKNRSPEENTATIEEGCGTGSGFTGSSRTSGVNLEVSKISVVGDPHAPITIVEFADFLCPYCKTASESLKSVIDHFAGRVNLVFINHPLDKKCNRNVKSKLHDGACLLAKGAICASRQNRFSEYQDAAFALSPKNAGESELRQLAILARLELPVFTNCLDLPQTAAELNNQIELAHKLSITSIPAIFINGKQILNWNNKAAMLKMIEEELKNIPPPVN